MDNRDMYIMSRLGTSFSVGQLAFESLHRLQVRKFIATIDSREGGGIGNVQTWMGFPQKVIVEWYFYPT